MSSESLNYASDFRAQAVEASEAALRARGLTEKSDPLMAGMSYCLYSWEDPEPMRRRLKACVLGGLVIAVAFLGGAAWLLSVFEGKAPLLEGSAIAAGICGLGLLCSLPVIERAMVRAMLKRRMPELWERPAPPMIAGIEDAHTYHRAKVIADDFAAVTLHPESGCVELEGLSHRYLVIGFDNRRDGIGRGLWVWIPERHANQLSV